MGETIDGQEGILLSSSAFVMKCSVYALPTPPQTHQCPPPTVPVNSQPLGCQEGASSSRREGRSKPRLDTVVDNLRVGQLSNWLSEEAGHRDLV
jgi:hypothetical protein